MAAVAALASASKRAVLAVALSALGWVRVGVRVGVRVRVRVRVGVGARARVRVRVRVRVVGERVWLG